MPVKRRGILLRLPLDLYPRIQEAKGPLSRNLWIERLIARELEAFQKGEALVGVPATTPQTERPSPMVGEVGEPAPLYRLPDDDDDEVRALAAEDEEDEWWR